MVYRQNEMKIELKEHMRGGEGTVHIRHFLDESGETHTRMLAELTLPPGASIGYHQHDKETEYFFVVSGSGVFNDNGAEVPVKAGDAMSTGNGASHGIRNTGSEPLVFHAVIITYDEAAK